VKQPLGHLLHKAIYHGRHRLAGAWGTCMARIQLSLVGTGPAPGLRVYGPLHIYISRHGALQLGENNTIISRALSNLVGVSQAATFQTIDEGRIQIGNHAAMTACVFSARESIQVGARATIGGNVRIYDHDFHSLNPQDRQDPVLDKQNIRSKPVLIGDDVFIGVNATILKGTRIGDRSIIGAGAIVAGLDIPPDSVVAGNPARIL
jgi:acetyltransferase-like isoleucine patch superfamily enzyme